MAIVAMRHESRAERTADSIKQAAKTIAAGMTQYYTGYRAGDVPGNLPAPYCTLMGNSI
jgi:hypothetical protein